MNTHGEVGNGTTTDSTTAVGVLGLTGATAISVGYSHSCALVTGGAVKCWGLNSEGQLGNGTTTDSTTPVGVVGLTGATAISAGLYHTCAIVAEGAVKCWGAASRGQLGDGKTYPIHAQSSSSPVGVVGVTGATAITAGLAHTCAIVAGGAVKCWGWNSYGQLGDGSTYVGEDSSSNIPVDVNGLTGVITITAGYGHTCAQVTGGAVRCWGYNFNGQLGDGDTTDTNVPVTVLGIP